MRKLTSLIVVLFLFTSCASSTVIRSSDPAAKIYVDGEYRGIGSVSHTDSKTAFAHTSLRFEKAGCKEQNVTLDRGQEFKVGPFIGGLFLLVPLLWVSGYKAENTFEYSCTNP